MPEVALDAIERRCAKTRGATTGTHCNIARWPTAQFKRRALGVGVGILNHIYYWGDAHILPMAPTVPRG